MWLIMRGCCTVGLVDCIQYFLIHGKKVGDITVEFHHILNSQGVAE